jgi:hypothetical protein
MPVSRMGALVIASPGEAARLILRAIDRAGGNRRRAALLLNIAPKMLYVYIRRLGLWADIDDLVRKRGYFDPHAPPCRQQRSQFVEGTHGKPWKGYVDRRYKFKLPDKTKLAAVPPKRHSPVRFDTFDPSLADEASVDGWRKFP